MENLSFFYVYLVAIVAFVGYFAVRHVGGILIRRLAYRRKIRRTDLEDTPEEEIATIIRYRKNL